MEDRFVRMRGVVAPRRYFLLTDMERAEICNGAGSKGIGGWLVPDTIYGLSITEAANVHDYMYATPQYSRQACDKLFLKNMLSLIDAKEDSWGWVKKLRYARAHTYYYAVKNFGGFFRKGK